MRLHPRAPARRPAFRLAAPVLALLLASSALAGCRTVRLSAEARRSVEEVVVASEIEERGSYSGELPGLPVATRGAMWYSTWLTAPVGVVIDLVDWPENARRRSRALGARLRESGIDPGAMVRGELVDRLARAHIFPRVERDDDRPSATDRRATLRLRVEYGLSDGLGIRGTWKPWLEAEGVLLDEEEQVLWRKSAEVRPGDPRLPEFHEPFRRTEYLRKAYDFAARLIASELIAHLEDD